MTPLETAIGNFLRAMQLAGPYLNNLPSITVDMTAQQARLLETAADKWGIASDFLAVVARLRLKELQAGGDDD